MPNLKRKVPRKLLYLVTAGIFLSFLFLKRQTSISNAAIDYFHEIQTTSFSKSERPPCHNLPGAQDVLVVLKTGATELQEKLPVHLNTTLRCYSDYMLFSDHEEDFEGEHIHDALKFVDPVIQQQHPDFELWRRLQKGGLSALKEEELSERSSSQNGATGRPDNPGWRIDRFKFLPMANMTLQAYPDKKWYVFVETDTYILWQSLLNYLKVLDWQKRYYIGAQVFTGPQEFAHGGSGFVVSRAALEQVVLMFTQRQSHWETITANHWAGDAVLGTAFMESGIPLHEAWPILQADDIGHMTFGRQDGPVRMWCRPTISYHHLTPSAVQSLWEFEQYWIKDTKDPSAFLRHKNMYAQYVLPRVRRPKKDWNNDANDDRGPVPSLQACREICHANTTCVQYALNPKSRCMITNTPNLGEKSVGYESGWVLDRMHAWSDNMAPCQDQDWFV